MAYTDQWKWNAFYERIFQPDVEVNVKTYATIEEAKGTLICASVRWAWGGRNVDSGVLQRQQKIGLVFDDLGGDFDLTPHGVDGDEGAFELFLLA